MITTLVATSRVLYTGAVNKTISFGMSNSEYTIENIDGLGPMAATIIRTELASEAGTKRLATKLEERSIVLTIGFAPSRGSANTVETLRRNLKTLFMPGRPVELEFVDTLLGSYIITGSVETHEPSIFSKDPQVVVSVLCTDPYFYKKNETVTFNVPEPTSNNGHLAEFFTMTCEAEVPIGFLYEGTVRYNTAFLDLRLNDYPATSTNAQTPEQRAVYNPIRARMDYAFLVGDIVRINSIRGQMAVTRQRSGVTADLIPYFSGSLSGMKLAQGFNSFRWFPTVLIPGTGIPGPPTIPNQYHFPLANGKISYNKAIGGF